MLRIVNTPTGNTIAEFSTEKAAEAYLETIETSPPTHQIFGDEDLNASVNDYE
jgi:hypothetical protein